MKCYLLVSLIFIGQMLSAQSFTEKKGTPFLGVQEGTVAFADVDGDDDQDVLITGEGRILINGVIRTPPISKLYINDGLGNFTEMIGDTLHGVEEGDGAFADVDGDGDQDVLITGQDNDYNLISKLYINDGLGNFTELMGTPFEGVSGSAIAFADVDGDSDQDVLITGVDSSWQTLTSKLYKNDGLGNFTEVMGTPFEKVVEGTVAFADVDDDSDQDVFITGFTENRTTISKLYKNDGLGGFAEVVGAPFEGVSFSSMAFSDVDGDNDKDVLIAGVDTSITPFAKLYTNDGLGNFTEVVGAPFDFIAQGSIALADVDGDSDQDLLISGSGIGGAIAKLYTNDGFGNFTEVVGTPFEGVRLSAIAFADVDGDSDQDLLITGADSSWILVMSKLYINDGLTFTSDFSDFLEFEFILYPNPSGVDKINVRYSSEVTGYMTVSVFDINGRLICYQREQQEIGEHSFDTDISSLTKGSYFIQLDDGTRKGVRQFLID